MGATNPIPGRSCGPCTACCTVLPIETPTFTKPPNITCMHCSAERCGIYETRPEPCRGYHCIWRQAPKLGEEWRPDIIGVLVTDEYDDVPVGYALPTAIRFIVFQNETVVKKKEFVRIIAELVAARMPVFLSLPGPPGCYAAKLFLNRALEEPVKAGALEKVADILGQGIAKLKTFPFPRFGLEMKSE